MPTQGPNSSSTVVNDASIGTLAWSTITNVTSSDNTYARINTTGNGTANYIKCTDFGFSIPAGATIDGITVEVECRRFSGGSGTVEDDSIRLVKGGTIVGSDLGAGIAWPTADTYRTFGGATNLWGESWTDSDINASDFGVVFNAALVDPASSSVIAFVDHIRITVDYTTASNNALLVVSD